MNTWCRMSRLSIVHLLSHGSDPKFCTALRKLSLNAALNPLWLEKYYFGDYSVRVLSTLKSKATFPICSGWITDALMKALAANFGRMDNKKLCTKRKRAPLILRLSVKIHAQTTNKKDPPADCLNSPRGDHRSTVFHVDVDMIWGCTRHKHANAHTPSPHVAGGTTSSSCELVDNLVSAARTIPRETVAGYSQIP